MLSCPYQGLFTQSTKLTENVWEKLSKVFFRKVYAALFECSENYLFQCLTYHRQCKGQQKWFCKNYTSRIHSRRNLPNTLNRWNNSYSQRQKRESEIDPETTILCNPWIHSWFGDIFFSVLKGWLFQPSQNFSKCWLILGKNT